MKPQDEVTSDEATRWLAGASYHHEGSKKQSEAIRSNQKQSEAIGRVIPSRGLTESFGEPIPRGRELLVCETSPKSKGG